ncbi:MAG: hypothetical protein HGA38_03100 [Candidatus Moranbacteria bacterium]|nr:hypothetical protein [Candidatus Moranbacteria bacterium]
MSDTNGKEAVLFMFECGKCAKRGAFWQDGTEWEYCPKCVKCGAEATAEHEKRGKTIVTTYSCERCGHVEKDTMDLEVKSEALEPEDPEDPNFEEDRKRYCIPEMEGEEILRRADELKALMDRWKDVETRETVQKIRKLTVPQVRSLLTPLFEKAGYERFETGAPEIRKDVVLPFSVQDSKSGRSDYDSRGQLKKILTEVLHDTNWRLMSDGLQYRLGVLEGRLRGVEGEENLWRLAKGDKK